MDTASAARTPLLLHMLCRGVRKISLATPLLERFAWFTTRDYSIDNHASEATAAPYGTVALFDGQHGGINAVGQAYADV